MMFEMGAIEWIILATIVEAPALTLLRIGGLTNILAASVIFAFVVVPVLGKALEYEGIAIVNFLWNVLSTILMFTIGIFLFKEKVANLQIIGIILSLLGLSLVILSK